MKKENTETTLNAFLAKVKFYYPLKEADEIFDAYEMAKTAHEGQKRDSGRPYITHPVTVADIVSDLCMPCAVVCAALLHDTIEDTYITDAMLRQRFGDEVTDLVQGVTKLRHIQFESREVEQAENIRKMFVAMSKDIRILIIKLADRLHNMRSLEYKTVEKQIRMARETLDIYAPLAARMGISTIKCELEDLSLKFLDREMYNYLSRHINTTKEERREITEDIIARIKALVGQHGLSVEVNGRTKHFYSIYNKMKKRGKSLEEIYDITAFRIICKSVADCYTALSAIHGAWIPIPARLKDYIGGPKPNGYQSLHTSVITDEGLPIEIQIRTEEMHRVAEYGIAAHWKYKEMGGSIPIDESKQWFDDMVNYGSEVPDSREFLRAVVDESAALEEIFALTPKGEAKRLAKGANSLDFAYSVHSEVGNKCVGAKVNGKLVPLETKLSTGDVVEIMTNPNSKGPSRDWLKIAQTVSARVKIRQFFRREMKEENIKIGKQMLEREAGSMGYTFSNLLTDTAREALFKRYCFNSLDEVYASVGYGGLTVNQILLKLINVNRETNTNALLTKSGTELPTHAAAQSGKGHAVMVKGLTDLPIRFSRCCAPLPGDRIIGYISHGRGVTIHRADCISLKGLEEERFAQAEWLKNANSETYLASIQVVSENKSHVLANITKIIANEKIDLIALNARKDRNNNAVAQISVEIKDQTQLEALMKKLRSLPNSLDVFRV